MENNQITPGESGNQHTEADEAQPRVPHAEAASAHADDIENGEPKNRRDEVARAFFWDWKFSSVSQAILGFAIFAASCVQVIVFLRQTRIMQTQAGIMDKQASIQAAQGQDERIFNRAWLEAHLVPTQVSFDKDGAEPTFEISVQNAGHSPAMYVTEFEWIDVLGNKMRDPRVLLPKRIADFERMRRFAPGFTLIPGETLRHGLTLTIPQASIQESLYPPAILPVVTLILGYQLPFERTTDPIHLTCYFLDVRERHNGEANPDTVWTTKGTIPASSLVVLQDSIYGSGTCDN